MMRVVTWNCRRASQSSDVWDYLCELSPDIAILQEVTSLPKYLGNNFKLLKKRPTAKSGAEQRFYSVVLVRGEITQELQLRGSSNWVSRELQLFSGNLLSCKAIVCGVPLSIVAVYSPAWPIDRVRLEGIDVASVKLTQNADVWVADLLWSALQTEDLVGNRWVIAGDFNLSETFDSWRGGPRGNLEYLKRMAALGLTECLRDYQGKLTPTFRNPHGGAIKHQMDHMFITDLLSSRPFTCNTGDYRRIFDASLSDHLPIIADFSLE